MLHQYTTDLSHFRSKPQSPQGAATGQRSHALLSPTGTTSTTLHLQFKNWVLTKSSSGEPHMSRKCSMRTHQRSTMVGQLAPTFPSRRTPQALQCVSFPRRHQPRLPVLEGFLRIHLKRGDCVRFCRPLGRFGAVEDRYKTPHRHHVHRRAVQAALSEDDLRVGRVGPQSLGT